MIAVTSTFVLSLVASARKALRVINYYEHTHGTVARACLRERLADLAELGEVSLVHDLVEETKNQGVTL